MAAKIEQAYKTFLCCGKYYAQTKKAKDEKVICPSCGKELIAPVKTPIIKIVDKK